MAKKKTQEEIDAANAAMRQTLAPPIVGQGGAVIEKVRDWYAGFGGKGLFADAGKKDTAKPNMPIKIIPPSSRDGLPSKTQTEPQQVPKSAYEMQPEDAISNVSWKTSGGLTDEFNARADIVGGYTKNKIFTNEMMNKTYGTPTPPADGSVFGKMGLPEYKPYEQKTQIGAPPSEPTSTGALHETLKGNLEKVMSKMDDIRSTMFMRSHMKKSERAFWGNAMAAYSQMANQLSNNLAEIEKGRTGLPLEGYKAQNLGMIEAEKTGIEGRKATATEYGLPWEVEEKRTKSDMNINQSDWYKSGAEENRAKILGMPKSIEEAIRIKQAEHVGKTDTTEAEKAFWRDLPKGGTTPERDKMAMYSYIKSNPSVTKALHPDGSGREIFKLPGTGYWVDKGINKVTDIKD